MIIARISSQFSSSKSIKLFLFSLMVVQLVDVTLKYRQYKTSIKSEIKYFEKGDLPSITLCRRDFHWKFIQKNVTEDKLYYSFQYASENKTKVEAWTIIFSIGSLTETRFEKPWIDDNYYSHMTDIIFTNVSKLKCMTFFSKLQLKSNRDSNYRLKKTWISLKDNSHHNYYLSIHPSNQIITSIPRDQIIINSFTYYFHLNPKTEYLMPPPYDTNCVNYDENIGKKDAARSMIECEYNCEIYNVTDKNIACRCDRDCKMETYYLNLVARSENRSETEIVIVREDREEYLYHLPIVSFTSYLCSIGGMIGVWIGICVYGGIKQIICFIMNQKNKKLNRKRDFFNRTMKKIQSTFFNICIIFSFMQTYMTLSQYLTHEYIIRISSQITFRFPSFKHNLTPVSQIFEPKLFNTLSQSERKIFVKKYFSEIVNVECTILADNKSLSCQDYLIFEDYYNWSKNTLNKLTIVESRVNLTQNELLSYYKKPVLKYQTKFKLSGISQYEVIKGSIGDDIPLTGYKQFQYDFSFAQRSIKLLPSPFQTDCMQYNVDNTFASDLQCQERCLVELEIESYGCLFSSYSKASTFFSQPFNYCTKNITEDITKRIYEYCKAKCKPNCNLNTYQIFLKLARKSAEYENTTIINIFPCEKPYLSYVYTPKMNVNELVYNLGGIASLWFGLSAYSIIMRMISMLNKINKKNCQMIHSWCIKMLYMRIST